VSEFADTDLHLDDHTTVLVGTDGGKYPSGNSVLVRGADRTVLIDPSVSLAERGGAPVPVDHVICSHAHEDHTVGLGLYPAARVHLHRDDVHGVHSLDGLMSVYGLPPEADAEFRPAILSEFHWSPRPDAEGFSDGHVFDLGGGVTATALHLPGHTRGHAGVMIEPGGVFFLADVDLTGFGPYYGDVWSDLEQFVETLRIVREIDARWYVTFHHKGVIDGRTAFLRQLDAFESVIPRREQEMLDFLVEPRSVEDMVARRFVYRPHVDITWADAAERRTAELHLARMARDGRVVEVEPGLWQAA
jgi:hydroxyacylglutathione hydrolase